MLLLELLPPLLLVLDNSYTPPHGRVVDRCAGNVTCVPVVPLVTSTISGVGSGEDELPKSAGSSLLPTNACWDVAPLLLSARDLGTPCVPPVDVCKGVAGSGCLCVRRCMDPKLQGRTSPCHGTWLMLHRTYRSVRYRYQCSNDTVTTCGTDVHTCIRVTRIDVVPNLPKCLYLCRRYPYLYRTELTEASRTGIDILPNLP